MPILSITDPQRLGARLVAAALVGGLITAGTAAWTAEASAATFVPHRAVYGLSLDKSRANGSISRAEGKLEFEWSDVCSGWTVSQRTLVQLTSNEGQVIDYGWTLNALEAKDGVSYRFFIRRFDAIGAGGDQRGEARLRGVGQGGTATFTEPEVKTMPLPKGTLFPTAHTLLLMDAIEKDELPVWREVFDGSGEDGGLYGINAALAGKVPEDYAAGFDSPLTRDKKSWRLHLAYFGTDESVSVPEHEQVFRIYSTGVVDEMLLDYGDFTLRADLQTVDALPKPQC